MFFKHQIYYECRGTQEIQYSKDLSKESIKAGAGRLQSMGLLWPVTYFGMAYE